MKAYVYPAVICTLGAIGLYAMWGLDNLHLASVSMVSLGFMAVMEHDIACRLAALVKDMEKDEWPT